MAGAGGIEPTRVIASGGFYSFWVASVIKIPQAKPIRSYQRGSWLRYRLG